ncbi:interleukin-1 receptor-like 1 isoform X2 [Xyrichtys novacula]|uniref:Interleukin-1 receptor-like 1 isoform X2 n=1 Tax=Xyrichtys novacula TaxID=13765 RepID=A0AAV1GZK5_XYRNO|nr:interleukin-1 receptor-like 1 isoform X2 [Xyrichtys novacula]
MNFCGFVLIFGLSMMIRSSTSELFHRPEGEAFYYAPYVGLKSIPDENITWYKNNSKEISNNEDERVHYHGATLLFLELKIEDSGLYIARHKTPSGKCDKYSLKLVVFDKSEVGKLLYGRISSSSQKIRVPCPDNVKETCKAFKGNFAWEKDFKPLRNEDSNYLWVTNTGQTANIYSCICTWRHNEKEYNTSGSRNVIVKARAIHRRPILLSPVNKEQFADEGMGITLNCSGLCGTNAASSCRAYWLIDGKTFKSTDGYSCTTKIENPTENTTAIASLIIQKVTAKDFQTTFTCFVEGLTDVVNSTLTLKPRESVTPLIIGGLCVLFLCVTAAVLIKYFAIDLALLFRPYLPLSREKQDGRVYDAYVVYKAQDMDKAIEDTLSSFVTKKLPSVLEEKCGYRLFIHGRDDIPGEDRLELVEDCMKQSRRLMVILTPGPESQTSSSSPEDSIMGGFDWQVGLHHVLVQREMSVILIQLGDMGPQGYTHLPPGLQHLIHKSAPIKWPKDSRAASKCNSRFWKRVRYLMPATPAKKYHQSSII